MAVLGEHMVQGLGALQSAVTLQIQHVFLMCLEQPTDPDFKALYPSYKRHGGLQAAA